MGSSEQDQICLSNLGGFHRIPRLQIHPSIPVLWLKLTQARHGFTQLIWFKLARYINIYIYKQSNIDIDMTVVVGQQYAQAISFLN